MSTVLEAYEIEVALAGVHGAIGRAAFNVGVPYQKFRRALLAHRKSTRTYKKRGASDWNPRLTRVGDGHYTNEMSDGLVHVVKAYFPHSSAMWWVITFPDRTKQDVTTLGEARKALVLRKEPADAKPRSD